MVGWSSTVTDPYDVPYRFAFRVRGAGRVDQRTLPALAGTLSDTDNQFLADTAQGASHELAISRLAAKQATQPKVKSYASMVVSDHRHMNAALRKLAGEKGATLPNGMSTSQQADLQRLQALNGQDFDQAYVKDMVEVNQKDQTDSQKEADDTGDQQGEGLHRAVQVDGRQAHAHGGSPAERFLSQQQRNRIPARPGDRGGDERSTGTKRPDGSILVQAGAEPATSTPDRLGTAASTWWRRHRTPPRWPDGGSRREAILAPRGPVPLRIGIVCRVRRLPGLDRCRCRDNTPWTPVEPAQAPYAFRASYSIRAALIRSRCRNAQSPRIVTGSARDLPMSVSS